MIGRILEWDYQIGWSVWPGLYPNKGFESGNYLDYLKLLWNYGTLQYIFYYDLAVSRKVLWINNVHTPGLWKNDLVTLLPNKKLKRLIKFIIILNFSLNNIL